MVATKKAAAKKAPAKKKSAKPAAKKEISEVDKAAIAAAKAKSAKESAERRAARDRKNKDIAEDIKTLKAKGDLKWGEIAESLHISVGKAMFLDMVTSIKPKDRLTADSDDKLGKLIAEARDEGLQSWGMIMARTGLTEGKVRKLYSEATGNEHKGNRIGKGGRYPAGMEPPPREEPKPRKAAAAKKTSAKKAAAKPTAKKAAASKKSSAPRATPNTAKGSDLFELTEADVAAKLDNAVVSFKAGGKIKKVKVQSVDSVTGQGPTGEVTFTTVADTSHTVTLKSIVRVAA